MTPAGQDLARQLVATEWWQWMPGVQAIGQGYGPWTPTGRHWMTDRAVRLLDSGSPHLDHAVPDLSDPATQGCLLAMLMAATSADIRIVVHTTPMGQFARIDWMGCAWHGPYGEALARALLAVRR